MNIDYKLLEKLVNCISPSGSEEIVRELIKEETKAFADEAYVDTLGNLIVHKKGKGKKVMLAAHMDEIGMMVTSIDDKGYIKICSLGWNNPISLAGGRAAFANGTEGVIHWNRSLENHGNLTFEDLFIDIGTTCKEDTEKKIDIGDVCILKSDFYENEKFVIGRNFDDRIGCYLLIEMLKQNIKTELDVYYAFTVQEEVGCRGGKIAAFNIAPDIGIAVDVVSTGDYPIEKGYSKDLPVKLGSGPSVRIKDGKIISDKNLNEAIINIAKKNNIKYQVDILLNAGTDAASMQQTGSGAASTCINIPTRYIHSPNEMISKRDIDETLKLLCAFLEEYNN